MFERLKSGLKGLVNKVTTTELKAENLRPVLSEFKISLVENDVAFPVAEKICAEMEPTVSRRDILFQASIDIAEYQ